MNAILIEQLNKTYKLDSVETIGLADVSVQIAPNRLTVLSGPSGSGKTTLLNMAGCIDRADSGRIVIAGQDTARLSDNALSDFRLKKLSQSLQWHPAITLKDGLKKIFKIHNEMDNHAQT